MEVDKETFFPLPRHDYFEQLPPPDIMWCQNDTQRLPIALVQNLIEDAGSLPRPRLRGAENCDASCEIQRGVSYVRKMFCDVCEPVCMYD
jgi:hypothetical protein